MRKPARSDARSKARKDSFLDSYGVPVLISTAALTGIFISVLGEGYADVAGAVLLAPSVVLLLWFLGRALRGK